MKLPFCSSCGKCCNRGGPYISPREAKRLGISGYVKVPSKDDGKCIYLADDGCILEVPPLSCRIYPLIPVKSGWAIRLSCPLWNQITNEQISQIDKEFKECIDDWDDKQVISEWMIRKK